MQSNPIVIGPQSSCSREIIAIAAVDTIDVNSDFKQFLITMDSYVAMNPL